MNYRWVGVVPLWRPYPIGFPQQGYAPVKGISEVCLGLLGNFSEEFAPIAFPESLKPG